MRVLPSLRPRLAAYLQDHPRLRFGLKLLAWGMVAGYFCFAAIVLALRYLVLPQIENYRGDIEAGVSRAINRPIGIRQIKAHWDGLNPVLNLSGLEIRDAQGRPALGFEHIEAEMSWSTLLVMEPRLARIELDAPNLVLRRDKQGRLYAAGLEISSQTETESSFAGWVLEQHRVVIREATISWRDDLRGAPPLELRHLNFRLDNGGRRHQFGLTAEPPPELAAKIDLRGSFKGSDIKTLENWNGNAYAELDYADLAGWRAWLDYPVDLPTGSGALRVWADFADKQLSALTADVKLADVRLRVRRDLPELDLKALEGRIAGRRIENGFSAEIRRLSLLTREGLFIQPTDLKLEWRDPTGRSPLTGMASANGLDLDALAKLAAYLPLDDGIRSRLAHHAPKGRIFDVELNWTGAKTQAAGAKRAIQPLQPLSAPLAGSAEQLAQRIPALEKWSVKGRFEDLGLVGIGPVPGISGVSGNIDGDEKSGSLRLEGQKAAIDLPTVFAEPHLEIEAFGADLAWKIDADTLRVDLKKATFNNKDAAGEASGTWRALPQGPGEVDLSARLSRGTGESVWRYMPLAVDKSIRDWLRSSLVRGVATEAALKLKGDLAQFPFRSGSAGSKAGGIFEVRARIRDLTLHYADDWPEIFGVEGELLFSGERMLVTAKKGHVFGVSLRDVRAEMADIESATGQLNISGKASGPTIDFIRFINASPVAESLDNLTNDAMAAGNGELDIKLALPLEHLDQTRVEGSYRFDNNRLVFDEEIPPFTEVKGLVHFTSDRLDARDLRANWLGAPLAVDIKTLGAGNIHVNAGGEVSVAALRRLSSHPALDHLSGSTRWSGALKLRKGSAEVKITSNLVGLSSSLPEPFNKSATEAMPFSLEKKPPPEAASAKPSGARTGTTRTGAQPQATPAEANIAPGKELLDVTLGPLSRFQLIRRHDVSPPVITRGLISVGETGATMPERGMMVAVNLPKVNLDFWRTMLVGRGSTPADKPDKPANPAISFDLRARDLTIQDKSFHDVRVAGGRAENSPVSRFDLKSRELTGNFDWNGTGAGKLTGRIGQFVIPDSVATSASFQAKANEMIDQMPALDITVDQLSVKDRNLGTLRVAAENRDGYWHTRVEGRNDDATLEATGRWKPSVTEPATHIDFKLNARSIEKTLVRIGYPDVVKRGTANLSGSLSWNGAPLVIDYASLNGNLKLDAAGGQFNKLQPGVGRLLGIMSLQSLPRRISLDFRDVFSEGFAFDTIEGHFGVTRGVMETTGPDNLQIKGPAAKVLMTGTVDLNTETQNMKVRVQPAVGESIAVGAMLANPVIGAVAWVAQKVLKDPLDQAFAFEYAVTGSWADPKVEKVGTTVTRGGDKPGDKASERAAEKATEKAPKK